jgi:glutaconate CoA-transferase subunit A
VPDRVRQLSLHDLVAEHIPDGGQVLIGGFAFSDPIALAHELIRQGRRELEVFKTSGGLLVDMIIGAGCVRRLMFCHVWNSVGPQPAHAFRRAMEKGVPRRPDIDELSYGAFSMALAAGAWGLPFLPTTPLQGTGHFDVRGIAPDKLAVVTDPFSGVDVTVVKPIRPGLGVFHVQRADRYGNAQMDGPTAEIRLAIAACERVFLIAEELVDSEVIRQRPELTVVPGFMVEGLVVEPWGAHPTDCGGYYIRDMDHHDLYGARTATADGFDEYIREWILDVGDHAGYRAKLGRSALDRLAVRGAW